MVPIYKSPNAQPLNNKSKVWELKRYDHVYATKELNLIKDTIKFVDELKLRYPNKKSFRSHINSTVSIITRIKEFNNECHY